MTCPLCGQQHKKGTEYCPVFLTTIPVLDNREDLLSCNDVEACEEGSARHLKFSQCPNCGYEGTAGEECNQCGQIIPAIHSIVIEMPDGQEISLSAPGEVVLGRESLWPEIAQALGPYDGVSRKHCRAIVDTSGKCVTVIDLGSTNGTWVGSDGERLTPNELLTHRLPVELHLGNRVTVRLRESAIHHE